LEIQFQLTFQHIIQEEVLILMELVELMGVVIMMAIMFILMLLFPNSPALLLQFPNPSFPL
jgi:hypothetical protein